MCVVALVLTMLYFKLSLVLSTLNVSKLDSFLDKLVGGSGNYSGTRPSPFMESCVGGMYSGYGVNIKRFTPVFFGSADVCCSAIIFCTPVGRNFSGDSATVGECFVGSGMCGGALARFLSRLTARFGYG